MRSDPTTAVEPSARLVRALLYIVILVRDRCARSATAAHGGDASQSSRSQIHSGPVAPFSSLSDSQHNADRLVHTQSCCNRCRSTAIKRARSDHWFMRVIGLVPAQCTQSAHRLRHCLSHCHCHCLCHFTQTLHTARLHPFPLHTHTRPIEQQWLWQRDGCAASAAAGRTRHTRAGSIHTHTQTDNRRKWHSNTPAICSLSLDDAHSVCVALCCAAVCCSSTQLSSFYDHFQCSVCLGEIVQCALLPCSHQFCDVRPA